MERKIMKTGKRNKRKECKGGANNAENKDREPQTNEETPKDCCKACFNQYNDTQQRPRVLPCGHSYCSLCISNHLEEKSVVCPTCRKEHYANNLTDFPINYDLEHSLSTNNSTLDNKSKMTTFPSEKPKGISKLLCSSRDEHCRELEAAEAEVRGKMSNLQVYESQMNTWEEEHRKEMKLHLLCAQRHYEVITCINKENQTVEKASGQADNILKEVRASVSDLNAADSNEKLFLSMERSSSIYDWVQDWILDIARRLSNSELIIRSKALREKSRFLWRKWETSPTVEERHQDMADASADEISASGGKRDMKVEFTNIQEKMKSLLANLASLQNDQMTQTEETPLLNISDLKALTPSVRTLIESNRVFAIKQDGSNTRYARISTDRYRDICVHTLCKDVEVPMNAILLQHEHVLGSNICPGLTFLDLAAEGRPLGRLRIRLEPQGTYPLNFHLLCTGEKGPSYAHSEVFKVLGRGRDNECVFLGKGGRAVVPGVDWLKEWFKMKEIYGVKKWEAGSVMEWSLGAENKVSQFIILTKDVKDKKCFRLYGKLDDEESLDVLKEALDRYCPKRAEKEKDIFTDDNLKKIVIADCGVIMPRH